MPLMMGTMASASNWLASVPVMKSFCTSTMMSALLRGTLCGTAAGAEGSYTLRKARSSLMPTLPSPSLSTASSSASAALACLGSASATKAWNSSRESSPSPFLS